MVPPVIQVVRRGAESWEITRVTKRDGGHDYESIGWVRRVGKFYRAFLPKWLTDTVEWIEQPREYVLAEAAIRAITTEKAKVLQ